MKLEKIDERGRPLVARALFGTDGIRGVAGEPPLDPKTAQAVGAALGRWVIESKQDREGDHRTVVIGMDTRESGPWLAAEVAAGLARHGVKVEFAGVTTTPGVAYLAKNGPFAAGVMISASHNPYQDNGIKLIGHAGYKLPDEQEELLEKEIFSLLDQGAYSPPAALAVEPGFGPHLHGSSGRDAARRSGRIQHRRRLRERFGIRSGARTVRAPRRARTLASIARPMAATSI